MRSPNPPEGGAGAGVGAEAGAREGKLLRRTWRKGAERDEAQGKEQCSREEGEEEAEGEDGE